MKIYYSFIIMFFISSFMISCDDENNGNNENNENTKKIYSLSGVVSDLDTKEKIKNVEVKLLSDKELIIRTDFSGHYKFDSVPEGNYQLSFSHYNYETETKEIEISQDQMSQVEVAKLKKVNKPNAGITDLLVLSDAASYRFEKFEDTDVFYWALFNGDYMKNYSEEQIIETLMTTGNEVVLLPKDKNTYYNFNYNLPSETNFTVCVVGMNRKGEMGNLCKIDFRTKSDVNQALTAIRLNEINGRNINLSLIKNNYCSQYWFATYIADIENGALFYPDIYWLTLYAFFETPQAEINNISNQGWIFDINGNEDLIFFTLGFDKEYNNSGVMSKVFVSTSTNSIIEPNDFLRSSAEEKEIISLDRFMKNSQNKNWNLSQKIIYLK